MKMPLNDLVGNHLQLFPSTPLQKRMIGTLSAEFAGSICQVGNKRQELRVASAKCLAVPRCVDQTPGPLFEQRLGDPLAKRLGGVRLRDIRVCQSRLTIGAHDHRR